MNETEWQTRVKEILRDFQKISSIFENQEADALAAITKATAEMIGKDDSYNNMCDCCDDWDEGRNKLKADQRRAIGIKEGADENV